MQKPRVLPTQRRATGEFAEERRPQCAHRTGSVPLADGMDAARLQSTRTPNTGSPIADQIAAVATSCNAIPSIL